MAPSRVVLAVLALTIAVGCEQALEEPPTPSTPTPDQVASCVRDQGITVEERERPAWESATHLRVGEDPETRVSVGVLFYEGDGAASRGASALRLAGEASIRVGRIIVVPAGPPHADAERTVLDCLNVDVEVPAP